VQVAGFGRIAPFDVQSGAMRFALAPYERVPSMSALRKPGRVTFDEYLAFEETCEARHELVGGVLFAMSGGTDRHNIITGNLFLHIAGPLIGKCQVFQGQMKLKVEHQTDGDGYYPDILASCTETDRERLYRREPVLLIEVLSDSTERYDRGDKMLNYLQIPSLQEYVLVAQDVPHVEIMRRRQAWKPDYLFMNDTLVLESVGLNIPVSAIYQTLTF
jgi:Uma2 family endonuclease